MKQIYDQLESFLQQMRDKPDEPHAHSQLYKIWMDPTVNTFNITLHYLTQDGEEFEEEGYTPIRVITSGYVDNLTEPQFKRALLDVFQKLDHDGHHHFPRPTYVSFDNDSVVYHVQSLDEEEKEQGSY
ncbi:MAG: hypothetical protein ACI33P_05490 [Lysinibacillus sp.]